jgi:PEP-CTERM motif
MKLSRVLLAVIAGLLFLPAAHADGTPVNMVFTGVNGVSDGHYYVSPYNGTMDGQAVTLFCDDILNEVNFGQTWTANVTNLASGVFVNTRYGNASIAPTTAANAAMLYAEAAWLTTQFGSHTSDYVSLQYALWDLMNPGSEPTSYGNVQYWLNQAAANYGSIDLSNFSVVTNTGPVTLTGQVQEFIVRTPEPSTWVMLLFGLGMLFLISRRKLPLNVSA